MGLQVADLFASLSLKPNKESWESGEKLMEGIKKGLELFAVYEVAKGIAEIFTGVSETAIAAERMAQKIGVSTEAVQELGYAAKTTGVSQEELQIGFTKMARGLEEFRTKGTGPVGEALVALKVPMDAIKKDSPDEVLSQVADRFADMPDGIKKTALAMEVFGKSGANLIPFLNKGGDGIKELRAEAEDLGIVLDDKTAKGFEGLEESTLRIHGTIQGFKNTLAVALLPTIKGIADSLFVWIKANRDVIASGIKGFVDGLVVAFRAVGMAIGFVIDAVTAISDLVDAAFGGDTGAQALLIGVCAVVASLLLPLLASVAATMISIAASVVIATLPFILIGAAVAAVAYGVLQLVKHWDVVSAAASRVGHRIYDFFAGIGSAIYGVVAGVINWVVDKIHWLEEKVGAIVDSIEGAINAVENAPKSVWQGVKDVAGDAASNVAGFVSPAASGATGGDTTVNNSITVNSPNADPKAVANEVQTAITDHWHAQMRSTHAAVGGAEQ